MLTWFRGRETTNREASTCPDENCCRRPDSALTGPGDLSGRRVGVRAYSQTTGLWLRGILAEEFGVKPTDVRWVTFEGAHVEE